MKYDNKLQEEVVNFFQNREGFHLHGYTGTFFFGTWPKGEEEFQITSKKPHGDKDSISARVSIYSNRYPENDVHGVEMKIEMYMWGYQTDEVVFQGWVESIAELEIILKAVGL